MSTKEHKHAAPKRLEISILSVSSTRTLANDESGRWIKKRAEKEGHKVVSHAVVTDDSLDIAEKIDGVVSEFNPHALLITGGTGISPKDVTIEAVRPLFDKELTAFAPVFALLSFEKVDSAAIMSRATAGIIGRTAVFCMPGSLSACKLACNELIFPEIGHIVKHVYYG
jgi:molybdenum cofactor biosynthesis protein B